MNSILNPEFISKIKKSDIYINIFHAKNYFLANIATKAIGLISMPIFTRLLTETEYGIYSVYLSYLGIFAVLFSLNSHIAVGRYYYERTEDFKEFVSTTLTLLLITYCITVLLVMFFYNPLINLMKLPYNLLYYMVFASYFSIIYYIYNQILVAQQRSKEFAKIGIIYGYSTFILAVFITYFLNGERYLGRIWASIIISIIFSIYFIKKLKEGLKFTLNKKHVKYILFYSIPLIPYSLSNMILSQFDRIMINSISSSASAGLYGIGYTVGSLLLIVIGATLAAMIPNIMGFIAKEEFKRMDSLIKRVFSIIMVAALGLIFFGKEIILILADPKFHMAGDVVSIIVLGHIFYGMASIYGLHIEYTKKMIYSSISVLLAGAINMILNFIYIPQYGYIAAAYTTVFSYFLMFLFNWITAKYILKQRTTPLALLWKPMVIFSIFIILIILINYLNLNFIFIIFIKILMLIVFSISLFYNESKKILSNLMGS